jgi:hypothetical protein
MLKLSCIVIICPSVAPAIFALSISSFSSLDKLSSSILSFLAASSEAFFCSSFSFSTA